VTETTTRVEAFLNKCKNHPYLWIPLIIGIVVIALASFTDSIDKLIQFSSKYIFTKQTASNTKPKADPIISATRGGSRNPNPSSASSDAATESNKLPGKEKPANPLKIPPKIFESDRRTPLIEPKPLDPGKNTAETKSSTDTRVIVGRTSDRPSDSSVIETKLSLSTTTLTQDAAKIPSTKLESETAQKSSTDIQNPELMALQEKLNDAMKPFGKPTPGCPDMQTLSQAFNSASKISSSFSRDTSIRSIIKGSLCSDNYIFAMLAASGIYSSVARDSAYVEIVDAALKQRNYKMANEVSDLISSSFTRDDAKKKIIDAIASP
jgi:hypothetical protein